MKDLFISDQRLVTSSVDSFQIFVGLFAFEFIICRQCLLAFLKFKILRLSHHVFILVKHYPTWEYLFLVHINKTISKWFSVRSIKAEKGSLFTYGHFLLNGRFYWIESIMKFKQFCFFLHSHIDVPSSDCHSSCLNKV